MLDFDLAKLYGVTTGALNRAIKRNACRFPSDFMFELSADDAQILKCQIGISSSGHGGRRRSLPYAFTEEGVAMLSSVLRSERAVQVNVTIMRAFVSLRPMLATNDVLSRKLAEVERRLEGHDKGIKSLFDAIRELMSPPTKPRREIGFHTIRKEAKHVGKLEFNNKRQWNLWNSQDERSGLHQRCFPQPQLERQGGGARCRGAIAGGRAASVV